MENKQSEIPEWKIPPVDNVCRRGSGNYTYKTVKKRLSSKLVQSNDVEETSPPLQTEYDSPVQYEDVPLQLNSENTSPQSLLDGEIGSPRLLLYAETASKKAQLRNKDRSNIDKDEEFCKEASNTYPVSEDKSGVQQLETFRKRSLSPNREQVSFPVRPRSKSLHFGQDYQDDQCTLGRVQHHTHQDIHKQDQTNNQTLPSLRSNPRLLNKNVSSEPCHGTELAYGYVNRHSEEITGNGVKPGSEYLSEVTSPADKEGKLAPQTLALHGSSSKGVAEVVSANDNEEKVDATIICEDLDGSSSAEYDTDCEPDEYSALNGLEGIAKQIRDDVDIGHLTYESACAKFGVKPRRSVLSQLKQRSLNVPNGGLLTAEIRALGQALLVNNRIEKVDLSGNFLTAEALKVISEAMIDNVNVVKLNLSMSTFNSETADVFSDMLCSNHWLISLDLSDCSIGDNEIENLSKGIQSNTRLEFLSLRKNSIGVIGAIQLGRALGENDSLKCVDLSWNHIRGGGAVAVCHSLIKNSMMEDLDLSWNGIAYEGSLALGSALRQNSTLKRLNLTNNRINWDCAPHLSPALAMNSCLECLELGQNPISMEGCEEILSGAAKPGCNLKFLGLSGIPINTKIVMLAAEIAKMRPFTLDHGGILNTRDVIGIQRARREDPLSLLIRYLSAMGIRVMDLFRMMDKDNSLHVSRQKFIQGLKRVRVPLDEEDIMVVARRLQSNKHGFISYQELAANVRNRIREDRLEDKRQEILLKKKKEERRRILQSDRPLNAPSYLPALYHMYGTYEHATFATPGAGSRVMSRASDRLFSPSVIGSLSRRSSAYSLLPRIASGEVRFRKINGIGGKMAGSTSGSPVTSYPGQNVPIGVHRQTPTFSPAVSQRSSAHGIRGVIHESVSKPGKDFLGIPANQGKNSRLPSIGKTRWQESAKDLVTLKAHKLI